MLTQEILDLFRSCVEDDFTSLVPIEKDGTRATANKRILLRRFELVENDNEVAASVEYRLNPDEPPVHRSAVIHLKRPMVYAEGSVASVA